MELRGAAGSVIIHYGRYNIYFHIKASGGSFGNISYSHFKVWQVKLQGEVWPWLKENISVSISDSFLCLFLFFTCTTLSKVMSWITFELSRCQSFSEKKVFRSNFRFAHFYVLPIKGFFLDFVLNFEFRNQSNQSSVPSSGWIMCLKFCVHF